MSIPSQEKIPPEIAHDNYIWKFSFYGFFKNLKFFEPYLIIIFYLYLSYFEIGLLISIGEVVTLASEIPSGVIADRFGRKNAMLMCFTFYIVSFVVFFMSFTLWMFIIAMIFFGLGEAFRSGTHKAIIFEYLEKKGWTAHKTYVYGRTRSYSLIGSSISAFLSVFLILFVPADNFIFLLTIIPYVIDFILVASYPKFTNEKVERSVKPRDSGTKKEKLAKNLKFTSLLLNSSFYDAVYKMTKDYIQPILSQLAATLVFFMFAGLGADENLKIMLGLVYFFFYILGSFSSKNAYKVVKSGRSRRTLNDTIYIVTAVLFAGIALFYLWNVAIAIIALYFVLYAIFNLRRPIILAKIDDNVPKPHRATVLSVESQMKSLLIIILSPILGLIADFYIPWLFVLLAALLVVINYSMRI